MNQENNPLNDPFYKTGLIMILISVICFLVPVFFPASMNGAAALVIVPNFIFPAVYLVLLLGRGLIKKGKNRLYNFGLFLILALISAYSLNREMVVFEKSVWWFSILEVIICINLMAFVFIKQIPTWLKYLLCALAGIAFIIFFYLAVYLLPLYLVSVFAAIALGISLHTFVPLAFCIYIFFLIRKTASENKKYWWSFIAGAVLTVGLVIIYAVAWNNNLNIINKNFKYASLTANNELPSWVRIAQRLNKNDITEKILKTDLVYAVPDERRSWFWDIPQMNFEARKHDPLVMIGSFFSGSVNVPESDRIKILESIFDSRHQAEERLWSGKDLITEHIDTNVELWPAFRMAYTELALTIGHVPNNDSWTNSQEAIYTFHLPEGSVVTALSLWIEGKEEKGILTTKTKADTAYKTIVGTERRDPSVVHWQEGNRVSVRVFPILKGESRKFKMGITSPLLFNNQELTYHNIYFDGPDFSSAKENIEIRSSDNLHIKSISRELNNDDNYLSKRNAQYIDKWTISLSAKELSKAAFTHDKFSYSIKPISRQSEQVEFSTVYLDINSSWSPEECDKIYDIVKNKKVYVSMGEDRFKEVTVANNKWLLEELRNNNFSLFPFNRIENVDHSIVVSKSSAYSPVIDDLRKNTFINNTHKFFTENGSVRFFNLGDTLSPYLRSLKEFRMLNYMQGDEKKLKDVLKNNSFTKIIETENEVAVDAAGISFQRTDSSGSSSAPDHLMRLFAYNHIQQRAGGAILADNLNEEPLIKEAEQAYVVSPFSSLIVLETQQDYDRFNIKARENSLQNASLTSKGAVPEPHEWALIIIVVALCIIARFRPKLLLLNNR